MPSFLHWYVNGPTPETETEKLAACPAALYTDVGCVETKGRMPTLAAELVTLPAALDTFTV